MRDRSSLTNGQSQGLKPSSSHRLTSEQQAAAYAPNSVVVTAGAGTGKTYMLAERYVYYLREKQLSPLEIVAVTFTEKAATELRSRIRALVRQQLPERLDILAELEAAPISTIHTLCSRICQEHFQTIGISADFKVLEDLEGTIWLDECLTAALVQLPQQFYRLIPYSLMSEIMSNLLADPYTATKALARGIGDWKSIIIKARQVTLASLTQNPVWQESYRILQQHQGKEGDKLETTRQNVIEAIADLEAEKNIVDALSVIDNIDLRKGSKKNWQSESFTVVKNALTALRDLIREINQQGLVSLTITETDERLKTIFPALNEAYLEVTNYLNTRKQQARVLTFNDLEIYALQGLQQLRVREYYQQRWQVFLVDEFQDTNPAQAELLTLLTERTELTIVGDIKQSIYGFRRADIRVFKQFRDRLLENQGSEVILSQSFRIHQQLCDRLNRIFTPLLAEYQSLNSKRQPPALETADYLRVMAVDADSPKISKAQRQRIEANYLAETIAQMLAEETPVYDKQTKKSRPLEPKDIAILTRTWQPLEVYADALAAAGIPVAPAGGGNLLATREAKDAGALLRFLANPRDDIALVAVLRSPFFALSDRILFQIETATSNSKQKPITWWEKIKTSQTSDVERAVKTLQQLLAVRYEEVPSRLLQLADRLTGYTAIIANLPGAERRQADWQDFYQLVKELEQGTNDIFSVVRRLKSLFDNEVAMPRSAVATDNAVSLMTIFAAKGLEWSLVVVADLSREYYPISPAVYFDSQWGVGAKIKDETGEIQKPVVYSWLEYCQQQREREEALRVLYVALTRARDYLILSAAEPDKGDLKRLSAGLAAANLSIETIPYNAERALPPIPLTPPIAKDSPTLLLNSTGANLSALPVTSLTEYARCPQRFYQRFINGHPGMGEGMASRMQVGSLVHKALEHNIIREEKLQTFAEPASDRASVTEALAIAKQFFQLPMYAYFRQTAVAKERHISWQIGSITFEGVVDLVGHDWVLDYKSDREINPLEHRFQLGVYARALERPQAHIAYLRHQHLHTFTIDALDAVAQQTEAIVEQINSANYTATPSLEQCAICPYLSLCNYAAF
ncbi:UvrD-helicase domain-containing protein [Myxosarcina sp. GI1]|uniref:UvrD-helicase domain-containing protein n=1 Tax=Myxosarcina sp. GI1 TaxID=1541065 RepID=UPI0006914C72|nr:UvrD-helicase domain-containing protein [Myxosarcina sp. GI1]